MPWKDGSEFAKKHWKGASPAQADHAKKQAEAMIKGGTPEGEAIATAIKQSKKKHESAGKKMYPNMKSDGDNDGD